MEPAKVGCKGDPEKCQNFAISENKGTLTRGSKDVWENLSAACGIKACVYNYQGRKDTSEAEQIRLQAAAERHKADELECYSENWQL